MNEGEERNEGSGCSGEGDMIKIKSKKNYNMHNENDKMLFEKKRKDEWKDWKKEVMRGTKQMKKSKER